MQQRNNSPCSAVKPGSFKSDNHSRDSSMKKRNSEPEKKNGERPSVLTRVSAFVISILICLFVIFKVGPWLDTLPALRPMIEFIEERDIDAAALYYTEIEEFSEANVNMENTMDYPPTGPL